MKKRIFCIVLFMIVSFGYAQDKSITSDKKKSQITTNRLPDDGGGGDVYVDWYRDGDGDSFGDMYGVPISSANTIPTGYVSNDFDCNDQLAFFNPNTVWYLDGDKDTFGTAATYLRQCMDPSTPTVKYVLNNTDCVDNNPNLNPNTKWYLDGDKDTFGIASTFLTQCTDPSTPTVKYVLNNTDCNDALLSLNPNTKWYLDGDKDTFGIASTFLTQCVDPSTPTVKYVLNNTDCNDNNVNINPNTKWYLDGDKDTFGIASTFLTQCTDPSTPTVKYVLNNADCNDAVISLNPNTKWYLDGDKDTFGIASTFLTQCVDPSTPTVKYVLNNTDCNDNNVNINPNTKWYLDGDKDTFGIASTFLTQCVDPSTPTVKYVLNNTDCVDNNPNLNPNTKWYLDGDKDTFGIASTFLTQCLDPSTPTVKYVLNTGDCNDADITLNPNTKWYADNEPDGLGDPLNFVQQCTNPGGNYVRNNTDNCPLIKGTSTDCASLASPSQDQNYIITRSYKEPTLVPFVSPAVDKAQVNITYFDGLGRPMQQIGNQQSNTGKDIVTPIEYDGFGRQIKEYLPYKATTSNMAFDANGKTNALSYYATPNPVQNGNPNLEATANPFSEKSLESSPLNRVLKQAAPGNDWAMVNNHTIKLEYQTNIASEVKLFTATAVWNTTLGLYDIGLVNGAGTVFYDINQLYKTVTYDENTAAIPSETAGSTVEFKNKEGQVVLKRTYGVVGSGTVNVAHDTYYVYDTYGNLTYVIPPKADVAITPTVLNDLCYQYKYDYRNRLVEKKLPGKQWEFIVYDKLDRPVATGPASSPFSDLTSVGWLITKYDVFSRPVYTGWMTSTVATSAGRKTLQDAQNSATVTVLYESKQTTGTIDSIAAYYTNTIAPTAFKLLTVNFYDNYTFPSAPAVPTTVETQPVLTAVQVKSLSTGSWTRVPTTSTAILGETAATFYDAKGRPVRSYGKNYLGGYTYTDSKLDFPGVPQYNKTYHKRLSTDTELKTTEVFTYSPQGRLMTHTHQINADAVELLASNTYDELGQFISKKVGNTAAAPTQKVDYSYNIRGWMTGINNTAALQQGSDPKDLFAFKINYNTTTTGILGVTPLYNGNIAETFWSTASEALAPVRAYGYEYDNLNRLKNATYQKSGITTNAYNESLSYDKNGNIKTLLRNGNSESTAQIDNLTYSYGPADLLNQLTKVVDNAPTASKANGFVDSSTNSVDDYTYDANGNMLKDLNKGIGTSTTDGITYNHLNLPTKIIFATGSQTGNIVYIYNAAGQKIQKIVNTLTPVASTTITDYLGAYQYKKIDLGTVDLHFFPTTEGYVEPSGSSFKYVYQYKDHLGNVRLTYDKNLQILEENNYYAFGLRQEGYNNVKNPSNGLKYKYNGKELQDELGLNFYDYGARNYDPALGRWMNIDPLAEKSRKFSPYTYALDNPVYFIDPDGMQAMSPIYGTSGQFLGTDDEGLKGKAVVMDEKNFKQGMSHKEALENSLGEEGLKDNKAKSDFSNHYDGLKDRPDYDGKITLSEANDWYRNGHSEPLFADLSKIDLKFISSSQFEGVGDKQGIQTLTKSDDGLVYGNITLKYEGGNSVSSQFDTYNFERHNNRSTAPTAGQRIKDNAKRGFRNAATVAGRMLADRNPFNLHNSEFNIYFYGKGKISK